MKFTEPWLTFRATSVPHTAEDCARRSLDQEQHSSPHRDNFYKGDSKIKIFLQFERSNQNHLAARRPRIVLLGTSVYVTSSDDDRRKKGESKQREWDQWLKNPGMQLENFELASHQEWMELEVKWSGLAVRLQEDWCLESSDFLIKLGSLQRVQHSRSGYYSKVKVTDMYIRVIERLACWRGKVYDRHNSWASEELTKGISGDEQYWPMSGSCT